MLRKRGKPGNGAIAILLACLTAILLTVTAPSIGLTWDEPAYIAGADSYASWFGVLISHPAQAFTSRVIDQYWTINDEHPPMEKIWSGLVWSVARHIFDDLTANRLGVILLVAFLVGLLYFVVAQAYGKAAGLFAAAALLSMPRFFFHAHLAALDVPVAAAIFAVTYLFWRTVDREEWWWGLVLGFAWGLAEATKLNATFLPIGLFIWFLAFRRKWYLVLRFVIMGIAAVLTFVLVWPWLYHLTWMRILAYVDFHLDHFPIGQWYFGKFYLPPPWHFPFMMLLAVIPLALLVLALVGIARAGKGKQDKSLVWLLIISVMVSLGPFLYGKNLLYDDERLFMPAFPFLAALAGIGFGWLVQGLRKLSERLRRQAWFVPTSVLLVVVFFTSQTVTTIRLYPHLLSYYSESVGGLVGATGLGLETTYWCETYAAALPYINEHAQPGDRIWAEPWSYDVLIYYQMHGQLRKDVFILNDPPTSSVFGLGAPQPIYGNLYTADWAIFQYRQSQYGQSGENYLPLVLLESKTPVYEVSYQGVPIMRLYRGLK